MLIARIAIRRMEEAKAVLERKLTLLATFLQSLSTEKLFQYRSMSIWLDAPLSSMGGKLIVSRKNIEGYAPLGLINVIKYLTSNQPLTRIIIKIEGDLTLEGNKYPAYIVLYNDRILRRIYGDLEFDIYKYKDIKGIYDLYLNSNIFRKKMNRIIKHLGKSTPRPEIIVIGFNSEAMKYVTQAVVIYRPKPRDFLIDVLRTIKYLAEERKEFEKYTKIITPYKEEFMAKTILDVPESFNVLSNMAKKSNADLSMSSSIMIAGYSKDSLSRFVNMFVSEILEKVADKLIDEDRIKQLFSQVIKLYSSGTKQLF